MAPVSSTEAARFSASSRTPAQGKPVLRVTDLWLSIQPGSDVVRKICFSVASDQTLCVVGESGSGKSITGLAIMGLLPAAFRGGSRGSIEFDGQELLGLSARQHAKLRGSRISMIFQEPMTSLNPSFTIGDQIVETVLRHQLVSRVAAKAMVADMLDRVQIPSARTRMEDYPHHLSGGMRQRVMIAMALINQPALLIADEPTTALDVTTQAQVLNIIRDMQRDLGTAVLLITHDLGVVAEMADDVAVMYSGQIVETAPIGEFLDSPQHPYSIGLLGAMPAMAEPEIGLVAIPGTPAAAGENASGCRFAPRCVFSDELCFDLAPSLESFGRDHSAACHYAPLEEHRAFSGVSS